MKTSQPTGPGWWWFEGLRFTPSRKFIVQVNDLVKVVNGSKQGAYLVLTAGSDLRYSTDMYEGTWSKVDVAQEAVTA